MPELAIFPATGYSFRAPVGLALDASPPVLYGPLGQSTAPRWGLFAESLAYKNFGHAVIGIAEIGAIAPGAGFSSAWFGGDFQAFRQAHLDSKIPDYCRGCYR